MIWDIDIRKAFIQGARRFDLHASFRSESRRLVLFGPSGAGKSQTLRMVAGLTSPDRGHIRVAGRTLFDSEAGVDMPARRRDLGYVFQDYALFPHLTVSQNIAFGLRRGWRNVAASAAEAVVSRKLREFELTAVAGHYPHQLSGGQRQRTALARALATGPRALLLDEPFAALDRALRTRLREQFADLQGGLDIPLALITHDEEDVAFFGGEVLRMEAGRVTQCAPVAAMNLCK